MEPNNNIDKLFANQLSNHRMPPPANAYQKIQRQRRRPKVLLWRSSTVAAAVVALLLMGGGIFNFWPFNTEKLRPNTTKSTQPTAQTPQQGFVLQPLKAIAPQPHTIRLTPKHHNPTPTNTALATTKPQPKPNATPTQTELIKTRPPKKRKPILADTTNQNQIIAQANTPHADTATKVPATSNYPTQTNIATHHQTKPQADTANSNSAPQLTHIRVAKGIELQPDKQNLLNRTLAKAKQKVDKTRNDLEAILVMTNE